MVRTGERVVIHSSSISRNYAEALLTLATRDNQRDAYGAYINGLADVVETNATFKRFLEAPQVSEQQKNEVLGKALHGKAPTLRRVSITCNTFDRPVELAVALRGVEGVVVANNRFEPPHSGRQPTTKAGERP